MMHKLNQKPATIYRSSDKDAPQPISAPGALATILKACLVTGYGDKQAAGWQITYSDENGFKYLLKSPNPALEPQQFIINDILSDRLSIGICSSPSGVDAGNIAYGKVIENIGSGYASIPKFSGKWKIVATDTYCWLFCADANSDRYTWYFFGALHCLTPESPIILSAIGSAYGDQTKYDSNAYSFGSTNRSIVLTNQKKIYALKSTVNVTESTYSSTQFNLSGTIQPHLMWSDIIFWDGANPEAILPVIKYVNYKNSALSSFSSVSDNVFVLNTAGYNAEKWQLILEINR